MARLHHEFPYYIMVDDHGASVKHGEYKTMQECIDEFVRHFPNIGHHQILAMYRKSDRSQDEDKMIQCKVKQ